MKPIPTARKLLSVGLMLAGILTALPAADNTAKSSTNKVAQPIEIPGVHNAFRASTRVYSGSQPEGDDAFAALAKLGVKTIVSVDGSKPDVEAARKHGLRYIHLPYGYDGIPTNRVIELAKLTAEVSGSFFVHCHHGKHRGPAAVAIICETAEGWSPEKAVDWLREAGTAPDYPGLYRAAREFTAPTKAQLAAVKDLPEVASTSSLVDAMVAIDAHFDALKKAQAAGWKTPPGHADISPPHEATILWEQFREMACTDDTKKRSEDYRAKLADAERTADSLRKLLKDSAGHVAIDASFKLVTQSCAACHKQYRNQ
jgi:protein tyrosine phosphatase (PTP) superfamily phosphohydrolase (DUF442 family)